MNLIKKLSDLQTKNEINYEIKCFACCGFTWKIGDPMNGYTHEGDSPTLEGAMKAILEHVNTPPNYDYEEKGICLICENYVECKYMWKDGIVNMCINYKGPIEQGKDVD